MQQSLTDLLDRFLTESLTPEERELFQKMLEENGRQEELEALVEAYIRERSLVGEEDEALKQKSFLRLRTQMHELAQPNRAQAPVIGRSRKWSWAAAVILLAGAGAYFWFQKQTGENIQTAKLPENQSRPVQSIQVAPGGNKAMLILADGTSIVLDSAVDGTLAQQGQTQIVKTGDGQLLYQGAAKNSQLMMNTISTPAGGQYKVVLPDGSRAHLNAGSSITFPAAFTGNSRAVTVTGEVFLTIAKNPRQPFIVTANNTGITVLGTSFNINAYKEEAQIRTTLIEGAVMVQAGNHRLTLKPGQQAASGNDAVILTEKADLEKVLAWTNGLFNFEGSGLPEVMRQLEYWYDIKVSYEGNLPSITFKGKMYRNVNLSDVLEVLQEMGLRFRMEGKNLIVSGK